MRARLIEWGRPALELIAPPKCAGCGLIGTIWCLDCRDRTVLLAGDLCPKCGSRRIGQSCRQCAEFQAIYLQARSYAEYRPPFRSLVLRLKYNPDRQLGGLAAALVFETLSDWRDSTDAIVPVPLGRERLERRGYNQVDLFGRPLAGRLGLSYRPEILHRSAETRSQVGLNPDQRAENLEGAFEAGGVSGLRVLLLDDVFTSGATGNACARALYTAGAAEVRVFTLARAVTGQDD